MDDTAPPLRHLTSSMKPLQYGPGIRPIPPPLNPFTRRYVTAPCGCNQRSQGIPYISHLNEPYKLKPITLTQGLHVDAEFVYEGAEHTQEWAKISHPNYIRPLNCVAMPSFSHRLSCSNYRHSERPRKRTDLDATGTVYRGMFVRRLVTYRCLHKWFDFERCLCDLESLKNTFIGSQLMQTTFFEAAGAGPHEELPVPLTLTSGLHHDAEFCYQFTDYQWTFCPKKECCGIIDQLYESITEMYKWTLNRKKRRQSPSVGGDSVSLIGCINGEYTTE